MSKKESQDIEEGRKCGIVTNILLITIKLSKQCKQLVHCQWSDISKTLLNTLRYISLHNTSKKVLFHWHIQNSDEYS